LSGNAGTAALTSFAPHRLAYSVSSGGRALLVTSEIAYPGWVFHVAAAGMPPSTTAGAVADGVLRSVGVPPGTSSVVCTYSPASFRVGLYVGLAVLAWVLATVTGQVLVVRHPPF
jgi:hypothetical protein